MNKGAILLVEDNEQLAEVLGLHLSELGYDFHHAADGESGLCMALEYNYSLVILDVMLPKLSGLDICKRLRAEGQQYPILMLTSKSEELDLVVGLEVGADDYVTKPFKLAELMARVRALLRRGQGFSADGFKGGIGNLPKLTFGELEVNQEMRQVLLRGQEVELTAREYDLLMFLASRPGRPFTRDEILSQVWDCNFGDYEHAVNSLIMRLRKKIETDLANPVYIQTVRGVGYRFTGRLDFDERE